MKLDPVVKKENLYMLLGSAVCTIIVQLVFWTVGRYDMTVLWGGLWGFFITSLNFFIMSIALQKAMATGDEQQAKMKLQASYTGRMLLLVALMVVGIVVPFMHWAPVLISVFFPRVVITVRGIISSVRNRGKEESTASSPVSYDDEDEEGEDGFERMVGHFGKRAASGIEAMNTGDANDSQSETENAAADDDLSDKDK